MSGELCDVCAASLTRDEIGIVMKYFGTSCPERYCKVCLAKKLECTVEHLDRAIAYFKSIECPLFF